MKALLRTLPAAALAGAAGFYGGLLALLAVTGLDAPGWAPVAMLAGAGGASAATAALVAGMPARLALALSAAGAVTGAGGGLVAAALRDGFEVAVGIAAALALAAAVGTARWASTTA